MSLIFANSFNEGSFPVRDYSTKKYHSVNNTGGVSFESDTFGEYLDINDGTVTSNMSETLTSFSIYMELYVDSASGNFNALLLRDGSTSIVRVNVNGADLRLTFGATTHIVNITIPKNQFIQVLFTYNSATTTTKAYLNGVEVDDDNTAFASSPIDACVLGSTTSIGFKGRYRDVRVYNHALSDAEILACFQQKQGVSVNLFHDFVVGDIVRTARDERFFEGIVYAVESGRVVRVLPRNKNRLTAQLELFRHGHQWSTVRDYSVIADYNTGSITAINNGVQVWKLKKDGTEGFDVDLSDYKKFYRLVVTLTKTQINNLHTTPITITAASLGLTSGQYALVDSVYFTKFDDGTVFASGAKYVALATNSGESLFLVNDLSINRVETGFDAGITVRMMESSVAANDVGSAFAAIVPGNENQNLRIQTSTAAAITGGGASSLFLINILYRKITNPFATFNFH
jgi:hypothetical protein